MLSPGTPAGPAANGNGSRDVEPSGRPEAETPAALLPLRRAVLPLAAAALLSACSGGGGAGRGMDGPAAGSVNGTGAGSRCVETRSFGCLSTKKWGLSRIRTEPAWSRLESRYGGGTVPGAGQTVGVIDTGIDREHPAFCGGSAACTKTVAETFLDNAPDETGTTTSHGTAVAGVIAGRLQDAPGVAWGADVAMFAIPLGTASGGYSPVSPFALQANDSRYAGYFNEALAWSSGTRTLDFVNLSFAFSGAVDMYSISVLRAALDDTIAALAQDGAADKTVFVWGAGNAHGRRCDPAEFTSNPDLCEPHVENGQTRHRVNARSVEVTAGLPARIPELHGHVIAVVAIGPDGRIADFSNRCGIAARWCLAAPGVDIRTAYFGPHPDTNEAGTRGVFSPDGTSVAAPLATGALVVMKHWFRDTMSNTELVTRLLDTANDSGIYADSTVYGHGLLDLDAATTPVGTSTLALGDEVGGPGSPVTRTGFDPGHAFGNGPALALAGREIVAFDSLGAPFWYDLGSFARAAPRATVSARLGAFMAPEAWAPRGALRPDPAGSGLVRAAGTALTAAAASPPLLGGFAPMDRGAGRNAGREGPRPGFVDAPAPGLGGGHLSLARRAPALDAAGPAGLGFTVFSTEGMRGRAPVSGAMLSWLAALHRPRDGAGAPLTLTAGWIGERETMLGSRPAGAFGRLAAGSAFVGFRGGTRLGAWRLDAGAEFGLAYASAGGGMVTGVSPLTSSAFALRAERLLGATGSLRLSVSQPLRVESGRAQLSVPVGRTRDRRVLRRSLSASLASSGRQIDLAARWRKRLDTGGALRLGATLTLDPGHDPSAPSELTLLAGWRREF